jgi:nitrite reductase/ring-hydroxylating ferredoxin subunit
MMERRKFLKDGCRTCLFIGAGFLMTDLAACSPASQIVHLPVSDNSVRLPLSYFAKHTIQIIRPQGWVYDIAVRKTGNDQYEALFLQCTHQKNQLITDGSGYICTLHGSRFTLDGMVKKGPAEQALKKLPVSGEGTDLIIQLKS